MASTTLPISCAAFPRSPTWLEAFSACVTASLVMVWAFSVLPAISLIVAVISSAADATSCTLVDACSMAAATEFIFALISSDEVDTVRALSVVCSAPVDIWPEMAERFRDESDK